MVAQGDRRGYQHLLDEFWAEAEDQGVPLPSPAPVSAAAFCKARQGLKPELLRELLHRVGDQTDRTLPQGEGKWRGRRVFGIDGTTATARRSPELWDHFGSAKGANYPQASVSILSDLLTGVTYDVWIGPYGSSERAAMFELLNRLNPGDVLVMDRGDPSSEVLDALTRLRIDFVIRVPSSASWSVVEEFAASESKDRRVVIPLRKTAVPKGSATARRSRPTPPDSRPVNADRSLRRAFGPNAHALTSRAWFRLMQSFVARAAHACRGLTGVILPCSI